MNAASVSVASSLSSVRREGTLQIATLGPLTVSRLCLGTMLMGGATPAKEAHRMLDRFLEAGGTFIDTADVYGDGESERTLEPWLARHRDEVVLATKVRLELLPFCRASGLGFLPWEPLGAGFLTGRYTRATMPADGRVTLAGDDPEGVGSPPSRRAKFPGR